MNEDQIKGKWKQFKGAAKQKWGRLTDDELDMVEGDAERLAGIVQERYGMKKEAARKDVEGWYATL